MIDLIYQIYKNFTELEQRLFLIALTAFLVSGIMWTTLNFYSKTISVPTLSGLYKEGTVGQPTAVNPILTTNDVSRDLIELLFSNIIDLTENYKTSEDGRIWKITLKENLRWSDGKPLTSDDVIFTIDTIQNPETQSPLFLTWQGVVTDRLSEREIEFTLRTPYAFFIDNLRGLKIIPKHIFGTIPAGNFRLSVFNLEPVANGPYKFLSLEKRRDGFITDYHLITNEYYSLTKPHIKKFNLKFYQSVADLITAFNQKKVDGFGGLNPKNIPDLKLNHIILEKILPRYYAIFLNKNTSPALEDQNVPAALNLATNKQKIIDSIFNGKALIVNQPFLSIIEGYDSTADPGWEFSLEKAAELLDKAHWILDPKTGSRNKKIGKQTYALEFSLVVPQIHFLTETIDILKEDWAKIGVKLNPIILNPTDVTNEVIKTRNYQMIIFGNNLKNNPDIFSFWHSSERFYPGLNLALYNNKKVDALLESIRKNPDNSESRKKEISKLQKLISDDQPAIFLYSPTYLYVTPKDFGGFEEKTIAIPSDRFKNINQWYLETERVFK